MTEWHYFETAEGPTMVALVGAGWGVLAALLRQRRLQ